MSRFAETTSVPVDRSRAEIEHTLQRYGADQFLYGWDANRALVRFRMHDRQIAFSLELPDRDDYAATPGGRRRRSSAQIEAAWEQAQRQRWRALALVIKAKLEAVESGITTFEDEFLAHIVLPNGTTVSAFLLPQIAEAYENGHMPALLPALGPGKKS
jgi:hypothetical protein